MLTCIFSKIFKQSQNAWKNLSSIWWNGTRNDIQKWNYFMNAFFPPICLVNWKNMNRKTHLLKPKKCVTTNKIGYMFFITVFEWLKFDGKWTFILINSINGKKKNCRQMKIYYFFFASSSSLAGFMHEDYYYRESNVLLRFGHLHLKKKTHHILK